MVAYRDERNRLERRHRLWVGVSTTDIDKVEQWLTEASAEAESIKEGGHLETDVGQNRLKVTSAACFLLHSFMACAN